jgi:hypothetical protein
MRLNIVAEAGDVEPGPSPETPWAIPAANEDIASCNLLWHLQQKVGSRGS